MIETILFLSLIFIYVSFLVFAFIKRDKIATSKIIIFVIIGLVLILSLLFFIGINKIKSDISRLVENSSPKKAEEVYALLFKKPVKNCVAILNFKDQVIPKIDCCIWMEGNLCKEELIRIIHSKKYTETHLNKVDSSIFLAPFANKPKWWTPQVLGDNIIKLSIEFNEYNKQTLFFGNDSSHVYLCDEAI